MPCYSPLKGYRSRETTKNGKHGITFNARNGWADQPIDVPCGQCIGCRLERSRQWAVRCMHEASLHDENCFLTLTYNNENLPAKGTLIKRDMQLFFKRLRKRIGKKISYYHCGEYGENFCRPHYHAIVFGYYPTDCIEYNTGSSKVRCSKEIEELWPYGYNVVGDVSFDSCAYVARYITKKIFGEKAEEYYNGRLPEYTTMSRRPAIGKKWIDKYKKEVYDNDSIIMRGVEMKPPKYYDRMFEAIEPEAIALIKGNRERAITEAVIKDNYPERLKVKEYVAEQKLKTLKRGLECQK